MSATAERVCGVPRCGRGTRSQVGEYCAKHQNQALRGRMWIPQDCEVCGTPLPQHRKGGRMACLGACRDLRNNLKRFGLTVDDYKAFYTAQNGACAGCLDPYPLFSTTDRNRLYVDHCHATGRVRGLLCAGCNLALGKLGDDPAVCRRLADYLERNRP